MKQGIIIKGVGGVYDVKVGDEIVKCSLRGRLRLEEKRILVGDRVELSYAGDHVVVERILPRERVLTRPPIANIDQVITVFAVESPKPNFLFIDRILVHAELANLSCVVIINKADLNQEKAEELQRYFSKISYATIITSCSSGTGLDQFSDLLDNKISALAGPSGVGKSSLLNAIAPELSLETGGLSARVQRGRHTTRSVSLFSLPTGGYVADTPGFSQLDLELEMETDLQFAFPEFQNYFNLCKFRGCLHRHEPGCAVKDAVESGEIHKQRYEHYLIFLEEIAPLF
ncbi:MAG: ribosome small subunit-dependent GTPase A [Bacillota bacterium]|nr:ribosome small subunit-dependent GTPase A [Bacillota bacterium]